MNNLLIFGSSLLAMASGTMATNQHSFRLANSEVETKLPKAMSDLAAVVGQDDQIYITGGCDSVFGSQYNDEIGAYRCNSISSSFYSFDPETQEFTVLTPMPQARYRHAAVAVNNQIWLVGGRDLDDNVVGAVDVYDLEDREWRRFEDLRDTYWLSDLAGFSAHGKAYFVGGFTQNYRALRKVWSIDPERSWYFGELAIVRHANLNERRGDVGVTVDAFERYAYVSGGSSHVNNFCSPLNSVERYDLQQNQWSEVAPLQQGRAGKTVLELNNQLVALGGAQEIKKLCNESTSDPFDLQTPVYEIEVYDEGEWFVVDSLSDYRFRSTSVVYGDTVYSFGGQSVYFSVCMCHPTVDTVVTYDQVNLPLTQPGGLINGNTIDSNFESPQPQQQEEEYSDVPEYYVPSGPGPDYEDADEDEDIEMRGQFGQDYDKDPYASEDVSEDYPSADEDSHQGYERQNSGFGGYQRDPNGLNSGSSGVKPISLVYTVIIGLIATIRL